MTEETNLQKHEIIIIQRDCMAMLVPSGARMMLHKGTEVTVTQALGDSYTVNVYGNLARIESKDADALGKQIKSPLLELPEEATVIDKIWTQLKTVYDPEIPVNIVDLGLVYHCHTELFDHRNYKVIIQMTLTAPGCGMGPVIADDAKQKILAIPEVEEAHIEIVFDPPWDQSMMSDIAKLELGMM